MPGSHLAFELLAWLAAGLSGYAIYRWRLAASLRTVAAKVGPGYFLALSAGSVAGAYFFGTLNLVLSAEPGLGRSILGGLVGGTAAVEIYKRRRGIAGSTGALFAVPLCVTIAVGRLGCFSAGLADFTYGTTTALPWGIDFGDGMSRHPVQIYESVAMLVGLLVLLLGFYRRSAFVLGNAFYLSVGWYGLQRFGWEFLKPYGPIVGPFNVFHALSFALVVYALWMLRTKLSRS
jgi:phosphatidylglycerol:prolipoprotein diacylglycerol transferase